MFATNTQIKKLTKELRNIGPKMASLLLAAQISSKEQLKEIGAQEAYKKYCKQA